MATSKLTAAQFRKELKFRAARLEDVIGVLPDGEPVTATVKVDGELEVWEADVPAGVFVMHNGRSRGPPSCYRRHAPAMTCSRATRSAVPALRRWPRPLPRMSRADGAAGGRRSVRASGSAHHGPPFLPQGNDRPTLKRAVVGPLPQYEEWFAQVVLVGYETVCSAA